MYNGGRAAKFINIRSSDKAFDLFEVLGRLGGLLLERVRRDLVSCGHF